MGCRHTIQRLAPHVRRPPHRRAWLAPTLASHQELDAGIAARQHADRKNLKKSKRPFANYFRAEYRTSPTYSPPVIRTNGHVSSYDTVQVMTNPNRSWTPFWGRATGGVRTHRKRQDVLEQTLPQFGDDGLDRTIERLLELRFQWDREDEMLAPSLVPPSMRTMTEHCLPFASTSQQQRQQQEEQKQESIGVNCVELDGEQVPLSIFRTRGRRKGPLIPKGSLGFSGVDTIPAIVVDATRGPLVSSPTEVSMNVRWKATNREAASVSEMLRLQQSIGRVPIIGLPTRSLLLLLKVYATMEVENPALAVSLAIAGAEHYHEYTYTQCLELLRCLRRVAYVQGLARLSNTSTDIFTLYHDATRCQTFFADYIRDAAPFLADRVWSRLPEHVQRLTRRKLFIDLTDLLMLAVEIQGGKLPRNLPNPVSSAVYASKYLFLRYTLQLDDEMMIEYAKHMSAAAASGAGAIVSGTGIGTGTDPTSSSEDVKKEVSTLTSSNQNQNQQLTTSHDQEDEECEVSSTTKPFIVWLCVSFFVRLIAEAVGDVLRHVEISLKQHVQLAKEYEATATWGGSRLQRLKAETNLQRHLDRIAAPFPRHSIYQRIGRKTPKTLRLRLIPLDVFLDTFRRTRQAPIPTKDRRILGHVESPFATVLSRSALAEKHIRRACDVLDWAAMMLTHCTNIVKRVPTPVKRAQRLDNSAEPTMTSSSSTHSSCSSCSCSRLEGMDDRFVWCEALVRSRVQNDIDSLFIYVPWQGLEEQMQTLAGEKTRDNVEEKKTEKEVKDMACVPDACFLLDLLATTPSSESGDSRNSSSSIVQGSKGEEKQITGSTTAEQKAQKMLEALQESVERFQLAVSNLIDAQEEYFLIV
ncbi:uncharacterized protein TM35_000332130 [Trypanosoma theileri]|uniref:Uncharacterized protein n=1 Tax=Trypanosoma theileri TaxID=67003 RepID=A0A1X0NM18_9TRYP|nr:uncharacterized protein TM35_000332130 [Trypanosoma theileri]ORC85756.1 hypothetical protein TM35_000332130 [Trypanosoma theileri]